MRSIHNAAVFLITVVIYSNVVLYMYAIQLIAVQPFVLLSLLVSLLILSSLLVERSPLLLHPLILMVLMVLAFSFVMFLFHRQTTVGASELITEAYLLTILIALYFAFSSSQQTVLIARYALLLSAIIAVLINFYDFLNPFALLPPELTLPGRAAGFYVNPNGAGIAILLSLILAIDLVPRKYREILVLFLSMGVVLTFSRGSILCLGIVLVFLLYYQRLSFPRFAIGLSLLVLALPTIAAWMVNVALDAERFNTANIIGRLDWLVTFGQAADYSANERVEVALKSLEIIDANPLRGVGLSELGAWPVLTHNMYLFFAVRYGVLGWIIYPAFIWSCVARGWCKHRRIFLPFGVTMLMLGLVSHNMMNTYFVLLACAVVASLGSAHRAEANVVSDNRLAK